MTMGQYWLDKTKPKRAFRSIKPTYNLLISMCFISNVHCPYKMQNNTKCILEEVEGKLEILQLILGICKVSSLYVRNKSQYYT